ncbi:hypothetical protein SBA4_3030036 [Candidatus Sulfopaludibacter sp. SbA4]|nr:hypothetical protein SBA4_3030036 [Candidatus Sulfopaludibacter sp. SbA4]
MIELEIVRVKLYFRTDSPVFQLPNRESGIPPAIQTVGRPCRAGGGNNAGAGPEKQVADHKRFHVWQSCVLGIRSPAGA